jgi:hypothetical protein
MTKNVRNFKSAYRKNSLSMDRKERKRQLKAIIKKQFSNVMDLQKREKVLREIEALIQENPKNNKDLQAFYKSLKRTNERGFSIISMACFLWKYESTYLLCIDALCRVLIVSGHDLFDPIRRQFADSIEDIGEVDVSTKLKFLERHDLELISNKRYQKIRNKIAHHDYYYDEHEQLHVGNEIIDIFDLYNEFLGFTGDIFTALCNAIIYYSR